jgi:hypothetical protein
MEGPPRIAIIIVLIAATLGFLSWGCWRLRVWISGPVERASIDFSALKRTGKPNDYLVCPPGCCGSVADEASPVLDVPVSRLRKEWEAFISGQPRIVKISGSAELQLDFEQRSQFLGFPDTITVRFYALGEHRSTLAIYSRSHYGYWDLGVNRKRVQAWLKELEQRQAG